MFKIWERFDQLKKSGVLGINRRIGEYILPHNQRSLYPLVDDKIQTYELAKKHSLNQPHHYLHISSHGDLRHLIDILKKIESCAIKPAHGAMGNGILIINSIDWSKSPEDSQFLDTSKGGMNLKTLRYFISDILSGLYSLSGRPDKVIIQEKLKAPIALEKYCYKGIPDIRIIVFLGYPVMAMLRCPTIRSKGRANLHQGAVGCGLNIKDGHVNSAIHLNHKISQHPDTMESFKDLELPNWMQLLTMASKCYEVTKMGYLGVDLIYNDSNQPLLLEMNARPGLAIQTANMAGLMPRLELIKSLPRDLDVQEKIQKSIKIL